MQRKFTIRFIALSVFPCFHVTCWTHVKYLLYSLDWIQQVGHIDYIMWTFWWVWIMDGASPTHPWIAYQKIKMTVNLAQVQQRWLSSLSACVSEMKLFHYCCVMGMSTKFWFAHMVLSNMGSLAGGCLYRLFPRNVSCLEETHLISLIRSQRFVLGKSSKIHFSCHFCKMLGSTCNICSAPRRRDGNLFQ